MDKPAIESWLRKHIRYLASFDQNRNNVIEPEELASAVSVLETWCKRLGAGAAEWQVYVGNRATPHREWHEVARRCAPRPMTFIGRDGDSVWLPFAALLRASRADLPEHFESDIPVELAAGYPESARGLATLGLVTADYLCTEPAITELLGAYSAPKSEVRNGYVAELAIAARIAEQELRLAGAAVGAKAVIAVSRQVAQVGRFVQISFSGTAVGAATPT